MICRNVVLSIAVLTPLMGYSQVITPFQGVSAPPVILLPQQSIGVPNTGYATPNYGYGGGYVPQIGTSYLPQNPNNSPLLNGYLPQQGNAIRPYGAVPTNNPRPDLIRPTPSATDAKTEAPKIAPPVTNPAKEPSAANNIGVKYRGLARVLDGNSIVVGSETFILDGADAPSLNENCQAKYGLSYKCGIAAKNYLDNFLKGKQVVCTVLGEGENGAIGDCVVGYQSLSDFMIFSGYALSVKGMKYSLEAEENSAKSAKRGLWSMR